MRYMTDNSMIKQLVYWAGIVGGITLFSACGSPSSQAPATNHPLDASIQDEPPPPPDSAYIARLSPAQTDTIRALDVPLVVPTAIPAEFTVDRVDSVQNEWVSSYHILYRDDRDRCFLVEYAPGGVGSIPTTEYRIPLTPPLFDDGEEYGLNYGSYSDASLKAQFPEPELVSDWLPLEDGAYRLAGAAYINGTLTPDRLCKDITPEEAVPIIESFAVITDEITGDK